MPTITHTVNQLEEAERIDSYLAKAGLGFSRSQLKRLFGEGRVLAGGKKIKVSFKVMGGEEIIIDQPEKKQIRFLPEDIPLEIVFEDNYLAVVNKPAGMVTHPAPGNESGTLANALLFHFSDLSEGYSSGYPGLVHRLDKNTSGLLVVAKRDDIHSALANQLQSRDLKREYAALIWGILQPLAGTISMPIGRSRADRRIMTSGSPKTREAITHYQTLEDLHILNLIKLNLETGRTHQIRTHLKEVNHPVFGDPEYGGRNRRLTGVEARHRYFLKNLLEIAQRQMLHARRLSFIHPIDENIMEFKSDLPDDFEQVIGLMRQYHTKENL